MRPEQSSGASSTVTVQWGEDGDVVILVGEFDFFAASRVLSVINVLLAGGRRRILVDLDAVTFMDGAAIGALIAASERALRVGGALQVTPNAVCLRLLRITGELDRLSFRHRATEAGDLAISHTPHAEASGGSDADEPRIRRLNA